MSNLQAFLAPNALKVENQKIAVSPRFIDGKKKPIEWEVTCITSIENDEIRDACTKRVQTPGKRGQFTTETDFSLYLSRLGARCTVYPDLNDAELQASYNVMGAEKLLRTMLTPGEYTNYLKMIQEINGFDIPFEEDVEAAKN